ncbi:hypothetical protein [Nevskia sp.]|uniref:hypothetical protein n=1 Tax=Nevskia sp. TaxID=1929292 RepID=UPI0025D17569|nr:hypothetical protein [Nevskia sp.]
MKWLSVLLVAAYPLLAHLAVWLHAPRLVWLALLSLSTVPLVPGLVAGRWQAWLLLPLIAAGLYLLTAAGAGQYALYLSSLIIPILLMGVFGSSLRVGQTPMITRMAQQSPDPMTPEIARYTRRWTEIWTASFGLMALSAAVLIALGKIELWSLMTNLVNYLLLAALFAIEYGYRRWRYPERQRTGFIRYLRNVAQFDIRA